MLKINASYGLKEGRPNYGSESALCSVEMEVTDSISATELKQKIHSAFCIVREQCREEISGTQTDNGEIPAAHAKPKQADKRDAAVSNAQIRYAIDLWTQGGGQLSALNARVRDEFGIDGLYELTKRQASGLLDKLKLETRKAA